jgi:hypothetical protein
MPILARIPKPQLGGGISVRLASTKLSLNDVRQLSNECAEFFVIGLNEEARRYFAECQRLDLRLGIRPQISHHATHGPTLPVSRSTGYTSDH